MRESREKLQIFLINVLTLCSSKGEDKTHSFPKPPHSWSKSPKLSWADWNVASAGDTHHASEVSNLELLAVQPKHPDAPLSDTERHWQGFPGMGALGVPQVTSASWVVLDLFTEEQWGISKPVYPTLPSKATSSQAFNNLPLGNRNAAAFMELCGWALRSLLSAENPTPSLLSYLHFTGTQ